MFANASTVSGANAPEDELKLRLQGLQHQVQKSGRRARRLAFLAILLTVLLVLIIVSLHLYHVMQYATVNTVDAVEKERAVGGAEIRYSPKSEGKTDFIRDASGLLESVTEYVKAPRPGQKPTKKFGWGGKANEKYTLHATYREGLFLTTKELLVSR